MNNGRRIGSVVVGIVGLLLIISGGLFFMSDSASFDVFVLYVQGHRILGAFVFGGLMFVATVFAPLTVLPLVPLVSPLLGPFTTATASFIGWTLGAVVAFAIARKFGQPIVCRFVPESDIKKISVYLHDETGFAIMVALRLVLPVDALSYALGLFTTVTYPVYIASTMIGILWFSIAFSYIGDVFVKGNYVLLAGISVASVAALYISWRYIRYTVSHRGKK